RDHQDRCHRADRRVVACALRQGGEGHVPGAPSLGGNLRMTRPTAKDFERFRLGVASQHRSTTDYEHCTNEELTGYLALMESDARRVVLVFLDAPDRDPWAVYEQSATMVYRLQAGDLLKLHEQGADREVLGFLIMVRCEIDLMHTELRRRLRLLPIGKALLRVRRSGAAAEAITPL